MPHAEGALLTGTNRLTAWLTSHWIAATVLTLVVLTTFLGLLAIFWRGTGEKLDPQSQIGILWVKPVGSEQAYAGNEACRTCHAHEFQLYNASPHAHTVRAIPSGEVLPEFGSKDTISDDVNGITYSVQKNDGKNQIVAQTGPKIEVGDARWAFGAGTQARTYLDQNGLNFLELRYSYYPPADMWNFTPGDGPGQGFHQALGITYDPMQMAACFGCHSTVLTGTRKGLDIAHSILNVGCESCHGPCRSHVESAASFMAKAGGSPLTHASLITPAKQSGPEIMQLCDTCHRFPVKVSNENTASEPELARFAGVALPRSRCFIASAGKLSCVTCHDPHQSTKQQRESSFELKCMSCHTAPHGTACARGEKSGCVGCHMPLEQIARKLPMSFHNHWIRRDPIGNG